MRALLLAVCLAASVIPRQSHHSAAGYSASDIRALRSASLGLQHRSLPATLQALAHDSSVFSASPGADGATVDIQFKDGMEAAILPREPSNARVVRPPLEGAHKGCPYKRCGTGVIRPMSAAHATLGQAIVLEPFASELGLGPSAGDREAQFLEEAGFQVTQIYNGSVTLSLMPSLSRYRVVDIDTHSGANTYGEGVIATGQSISDPASDTALKPYFDERSLLVVSVAGSDITYVGITSIYIEKYLAPFPHNALVMLNGCDLLRAFLVWHALQARDAAAMVSWDDQVGATPAQAAAQVFLANMVQGKTVGEAMDAVKAGGYAQATLNGQPARFGFLGDSTLTIDGRSSATPTPTETPTPTATSAPSPTAASTPTPVATATAAPPPLLPGALSVRQVVFPGTTQRLQVRDRPGRTIHFAVTYPNGDVQNADRSTDGSGLATYAYSQRSSEIARGNLRAQVLAYPGNTLPAAGLATTYRIGFGAVDLWAVQRTVQAGRSVDLWVHTRAPRTAVRITMSRSGASPVGSIRTTGTRGWSHFTYPTGPAVGPGYRYTVEVRARLVNSGASAGTLTTFVVEGTSSPAGSRDR